MAGRVDYLSLITSTKDYKKTLKDYIDDLGLAFHNAFLFEEIGD